MVSIQFELGTWISTLGDTKFELGIGKETIAAHIASMSTITQDQPSPNIVDWRRTRVWSSWVVLIADGVEALGE